MTGDARRVSHGLLALLWALPFSFAFCGERALYYRDHSVFFRGSWWSIYTQLKQGTLPIINLWNLGGATHEASTNQALFTPNTLLLLLGDFERTYDLFVLSHFPTLATGVFVLCRLAGAERVPAIAGGVFAALAGPVVAFDNLLVGLQGLAYAPWLLVAIAKCRLSPDWSSAGMVALAVCFAAQGIMPETLLIEALGTLWVLSAPSFGPRTSIKVLALLAAGLGLGLAAASADLVPLFDALQGSARAGGFTLQERQVWSLSPLQLLDFLVPALWSQPEVSAVAIPAAVGPEPPYLTSLYLGLGLPLAMVGVVTGGRRARWLALGALLAVLIAAGPLTPLHELFTSLPILRSSRYPVKYTLLVVATLTPLVMMGLAHLGAEDRRRGPTLFAVTHLMTLVVLCLVAWSPEFEELIRLEARPYRDKNVYEIFKDGDPAGLFLDRTRMRLGVVTLVSGLFVTTTLGSSRLPVWARGSSFVVVLLLDLLVGVYFAIPTAPRSAEHLDPAIARAVDVRPSRVFAAAVPPIPNLPGCLPYECSIITNGPRGHLPWSHFRSFSGMDLEGLGANPVQAAAQGLLGQVSFEASTRLFTRLGIARVIVQEPIEAELVAEATDPGGRPIRVYTVDGFRPYRAIYSRWRHASIGADPRLLALTSTSSSDVAVLWDRADIAPDVAPSCLPRILTDGGQRDEHADRISTIVETSCRSLFVVQEVWRPRWTVFLDGARAELLHAEGGYLAVVVPPGRHEIRFAYDSLLRRFLPVSVAALALALLLVAGPWLLRRAR